MSWTIKGESGAALDATMRTLAELNIQAASLTLSSLDDDIFTWSAATSDPTGAGTIVPDAGQLVEVFYNGTRRFRGHVTIPRVTSGRVMVEVAGPWWWLDRITLTADQADDEATTAERPSYVFPTQSLKTSLEALIDRAIANGAPIQRGTVAAMFDFPRVTITEKSCAQALADLMSICPDAVSYFDYSGTGHPTLHITRRGSMTATTHTHGIDNIEEADIWPRLDLEVSQVKIGGMTRHSTTGANKWSTQTAGTSTPGKNQILVVSGPEVNAILPKDRFDQFQIQTVAMPTGGIDYGSLTTSSPATATTVTGAFATYVKAADQRLATLIRELPVDFATYLVISNGGRYMVSNFPTGNMNGAPGIFLDKPNLVSTSSTTGLYLVTSADRVPEWATWENGYTVVQATLTGYARWTRNYLTTAPDWWDEIARFAEFRMSGYIANQANQTSGKYQYNAFFPISIPVQLIRTAFPSLTTIHRQWDYDYVSPPAGLAANLLATQNWIPYEGAIRLVSDAVDGAQDLYRKYSIAGGLPAHATMGALPKRIAYDIANGRKIIQLGAPARVDFGTLASKFRRHPKDNIVYI